MAASAIASQRNTRSVDTQLLRMALNNQRTFLRIVMCSRESVLRRKPVLYGDYPTAAAIRQLTELIVMRGKTTADKAAAVKIDNGWQCASSIQGGDDAKNHAFEFDIFYLYALFLFPG